MTVTFFVTRDTANTSASDGARAMAHVQIYKGDSLLKAQDALYFYMKQEARTLAEAALKGPYLSHTLLRRAADIAEQIPEVKSLAPSEEGGWASANLNVAGLFFRIVRSEA